MKKLGLVVSSAIGLMGLASACSVDATMPEDVATGEELACESPQGANYALAALAVATAKELKRWQTATDFQIVNKYNYTGDYVGWQPVVELSAAGKARCADGVCKNTQMILDWQKKEANGHVRFPGGMLQSDVFSSRLVANLNAQITCNSRPVNGGDSNCPVEQHTLVFSNTARSSTTCLMDYWFNAYKPGTTQGLQYASQLKNQLITFGYTPQAGQSNPYLQFDSYASKVKIDPDPGGVGDPASTTQSCPVVAQLFSATSVAGNCCEYPAGVRKSFVHRPMLSPYFYKCGA